MGNFDKAFAHTLEHEGGYSDDPNDHGGPTDYGISLRYLQSRGDLEGDLDGDGDVDVDDIKRLDKPTAKHLYHTGFWNPNRLSEVSSDLLACKIFDMAVNMGSKQAWKLVQRACNLQEKLKDKLEDDGIVGSKTVAALNSLVRLDYAVLIDIRRLQRKFYSDIIDNDSTQEKYRLGWMRRSAA